MRPQHPNEIADRLVVTTACRPDERMWQRARRVAERCAVEAIPREGSIAKMIAARGAELAYVVERDREVLKDGGRLGSESSDPDAPVEAGRPNQNTEFFVNPGLVRLKRKDGLEHPFIRSVLGEAAEPPRRVVDATFGIAGDALHLACVLGCEVIGLEASPVVHALLEDGLARMREHRGPEHRGIPLITVQVGEAEAALRAMPADHAEVVVLDPMFPSPRGAPPGYELFRRVALHAPLTRGLVDAAMQAARDRLVLRRPRGEPLPAALEHVAHAVHRNEGRVVDYLVVELAELDAAACGVRA